jgi:hypothetical protein
VTAIASGTTAANQEKTATASEEAFPASAATDRAAHDESAAAGVTTATDHDHLFDEMRAIKTAHVSHEDEAEATAITTENVAMRHEVPAAAHQLPAALADPTLHHAAALSRLLLRPAMLSRRRKPPMWR